MALHVPVPPRLGNGSGRRRLGRAPTLENLESRLCLTVSNPVSAFDITVDGKFTNAQEWSDIAPQPFSVSPGGKLAALPPGTGSPPANSFLYAGLDPGRDELYLMYDEPFVQQPPQSFPGGQVVADISFPQDINGVDDVIDIQFVRESASPSSFDVFVDLNLPGVAPVPASQLGIEGAVGFDVSPNSATPHEIVEAGIPLAIPAGFGAPGAFSPGTVGNTNGYSPDPAFWSGGFAGGSAQGGGTPGGATPNLSQPLALGTSGLFQIHPDGSTTVDTTVLVTQVANVAADHPVNLGSNGLLPVGILSSTTFQPATIDASTVQFNGKPVTPSSIQRRDVNGDGIPDLVLTYHIRDLVGAGALPASTTGPVSAVMTGKFGGGTFGGSTLLNIVPPVGGGRGASPDSGANIVLGALTDSGANTDSASQTPTPEIFGGSPLPRKKP